MAALDRLEPLAAACGRAVAELSAADELTVQMACALQGAQRLAGHGAREMQLFGSPTDGDLALADGEPEDRSFSGEGYPWRYTPLAPLSYAANVARLAPTR